MNNVNQTEEVLRLRDLASICYAGLGAECNLPEAWLDVFLAASNGDPFTTEGLLPFTHVPAASGAAPADLLALLRSMTALHEKHGTVLMVDMNAMAQFVADIDRAALASPQVAPAPTINGKPATAQSLLAAMVDIYDDAQNNPPEHRCYVEDAWPEILSDARAFLAAPVQVAPTGYLIDPGAGSAMDKFQTFEPTAGQMIGINARGGSVTPLYAAPMQPGAAADDARDACTWTYDEDCCGYDTACGNTFVFDAGGVEDNRARYCCYCGKSITPAAKLEKEQA